MLYRGVKDHAASDRATILTTLGEGFPVVQKPASLLERAKNVLQLEDSIVLIAIKIGQKWAM